MTRWLFLVLWSCVVACGPDAPNGSDDTSGADDTSSEASSSWDQLIWDQGVWQ